ncbi:MAG TPA: LPXTG cell wall anchor domain-containing protein [Phycicoccus sp.]|nr:LPXTG cell wall anchor domain-containing protein [Phycicoccus sp.]
MSTTRSGLLARAVTTLAAGAALVLAPGLATTASAADAPTSTSDRAGLAGAFIATTLIDGDHYDYPGGTYFDGGNTIDAILALDGAGVGRSTADAALAYLTANLGGYTGTDYASTYAGPTAKSLLAVAAHGGNPHDVAGVDLVAQLQSTYGAAQPGRFSDLPATGCGYDPCDYSNTIGQSLAMIALTRAGATLAPEATSFLLDQQCPDGGFRGELAAATCTSDPDATAFAAQALLAVGSDAAAAAALDHLASLQAADGGVAGDGAPANANTTGVAVQAFLAGGRTAAATAGQAFIASLQYDCRAAAPLRWGISFTAATRSTSTVGDSDLRATPQAALALAGRSLLTVSSDGSGAALPAFTCPTVTPTSTPTPTPTSSTGPGSGSTSTSGSGTGSGATGSGSARPPQTSTSSGSTSPLGAVAADGGAGDPATAGATADRLAQTGSDVLWPVGLGLLLVVVGALAVVVSRRRGAHS